MEYEEQYDEILDLRCSSRLKEAYQRSLDLIQKTDDFAHLCIAGELAIEVSDFHNAIYLCTELIQKSLSKNDSWYLSSTYLLRAFSYVKLGKYQQAIQDINESWVEDDSEVFWLQNHPKINKEMIMELINKK